MKQNSLDINTAKRYMNIKESIIPEMLEVEIIEEAIMEEYGKFLNNAMGNCTE